jgi:putative membrane protein
MASTASPKSTETAVKQTAQSVEQQTRKVADTARELKHSSVRIEDSADRTTVLAADRNILASERTYAAWVRTGLLALGAGIGARALKDVPNWIVLANGTLLIAFSLFCFGAAVWRHFHPGPPPPAPSVKIMPWPARPLTSPGDDPTLAEAINPAQMAAPCRGTAGRRQADDTAGTMGHDVRTPAWPVDASPPPRSA